MPKAVATAGSCAPRPAPRAGFAHSPGQQVSLPIWASSTSWSSRSDSSSSCGGWGGTSGLRPGEPGGTGGLGLISPSSHVQPRVPWVTCRMSPPPALRSCPPTHLAFPVPCRRACPGAHTSPRGPALVVPFAGRVPPLVSATAQGRLKLLAVRPTLPPTMGKALGTLVHLDEGQGTRTQPSGLLLPVVDLCRWRPGQGQPTWHGLRDFILGASPPSCRTGSVSMSPRKPLPRDRGHGPASHECGLTPPGFHWLVSTLPCLRQKRGDRGSYLAKLSWE